MEDIAEKVGGDFFVLPSSIHELLIVPKQEGMGLSELEAMVQEVNATQVSREEKLLIMFMSMMRKKKSCIELIKQRNMNKRLSRSMRKKRILQRIRFLLKISLCRIKPKL